MEVAVAVALQLLLMAVLALASYTDLRWRLVPNRAVMPALAMSLALLPTVPDWASRLLAALGLGGLLLAMTFFGLGMGDVKLGVLLGLALGFQGGAAALFLAGLACGLAGLALIAARRITRRTLLPFVPFMGLGAAAVLGGQALGMG